MKKLIALTSWLNRAETGDRFVFWATENQSDWANRRAEENSEYAKVQAYAAEMAALGRMAIFQRKVAEWQHEWIAVRLSNNPPKVLLTNPERAAREGGVRIAA